jgi:hypothetical protein
MERLVGSGGRIGLVRLRLHDSRHCASVDRGKFKNGEESGQAASVRPP